MKKLYILSELFYPNKTSTAYIMTELANYLSEFYKVSVITTDIKYDNNISTNEKDQKSKYIIDRKKIGQINKNSFFCRIKGALGSSLVLVWGLLKKIKKDEKVLVVTNPFLIIFFVAILRSVKKFEYILLVHDVFPENTIPAGLNKSGSFRFRILKFFFDWAYRKADKVIVLGEDMKKLLIEKGVSDNSIDIVTNWHDDDVSSKVVDRENYLGISGLEGKIVIGFAGNVGRVQGLDKFIKLFNKAKNNNLILVVIGEGAMLNELKKNNKENSAIYFLGSKSRTDQSLFLNSFNLALVTLAEGMYGLGVPSKSYNILKVGIPIFYIGDTNSEIDIMVNKYDCGWSASWQEENRIVSILKNLTFESVIKYRQKNQDLALNLYSSAILKKKFLKVLNK
ncbi:glycosyltransferase family 4 protein [Chryseobacterium sp.]|uniref:glycosyltransferase family 4 protein n=1 Tax=Chryseobacterium sp. TaxID=1871047 RepID=UPI00289AAEA0|nr:glycosyltransferase family 4 protein [Chryseobacterium sp.]